MLHRFLTSRQKDKRRKNKDLETNKTHGRVNSRGVDFFRVVVEAERGMWKGTLQLFHQCVLIQMQILSDPTDDYEFFAISLLGNALRIFDT